MSNNIEHEVSSLTKLQIQKLQHRVQNAESSNLNTLFSRLSLYHQRDVLSQNIPNLTIDEYYLLLIGSHSIVDYLSIDCQREMLSYLLFDSSMAAPVCTTWTNLNNLNKHIWLSSRITGYDASFIICHYDTIGVPQQRTRRFEWIFSKAIQPITDDSDNDSDIVVLNPPKHVSDYDEKQTNVITVFPISLRKASIEFWRAFMVLNTFTLSGIPSNLCPLKYSFHPAFAKRYPTLICIECLEKQIVFENIHFTSQPRAMKGFAIRVMGESLNIVIRNCTFVNSRIGICSRGSTILFENCSFDCGGPSIIAREFENVQIKNCTFAYSDRNNARYYSHITVYVTRPGLFECCDTHFQQCCWSPINLVSGLKVDDEGKVVDAESGLEILTEIRVYDNWMDEMGFSWDLPSKLKELKLSTDLAYDNLTMKEPWTEWDE